jgi:hypothetical protein
MARRFRPQLEVLEGRDVPSTLTVTNNLDSGPGSLRAEIAAAQNKDTIVFAANLNGQTITLTSGELVINKNLTIQGPGEGNLAISQPYGAYTVPIGFRIFEVDSVTATIAGLTISNGYAPVNGSPTYGAGGGILNWGGNLTVKNCKLSNNYGASGGGIANFGTLTVNGCTLSGNHIISVGQGGGIFNAHACSATVSNTTISGNSGPLHYNGTWEYSYGGGIYNNGFMTLSGTTVTNNSADWGGGIYEDAYASLSILHNSNVSGNSPGGDIFLAYGARPATIKGSYVG